MRPLGLTRSAARLSAPTSSSRCSITSKATTTSNDLGRSGGLSKVPTTNEVFSARNETPFVEARVRSAPDGSASSPSRTPPGKTSERSHAKPLGGPDPTLTSDRGRSETPAAYQCRRMTSPRMRCRPRNHQCQFSKFSYSFAKSTCMRVGNRRPLRESPQYYESRTGGALEPRRRFGPRTPQSPRRPEVVRRQET